jgi:hypothetical protein
MSKWLSLGLAKSKVLIAARTPIQYLSLPVCFALNDLRQLDAHQSKDSFKNKFNNSLQVFGISPNSLTNNYASVCDQVYDKLDDCFININRFLVEAHRLL